MPGRWRNCWRGWKEGKSLHKKDLLNSLNFICLADRGSKNNLFNWIVINEYRSRLNYSQLLQTSPRSGDRVTLILLKTMAELNTFIQELTKLYLENPAGTLPNALWKTLAVLDEFETTIQTMDNGGVVLQIEKQGRLILKTPTNKPFVQADLTNYHFALLHDSQIIALELHEFNKTGYFRLVYKQEEISSVRLPDEFIFSSVDFSSETVEIARFLNQCYPGLNQKPEKIISWLEHPVFHPNCWIWVKEANTGQQAALGIAEFDPKIGEGSLEWIQVHPDFRQKNLGTALVKELLNRLSQLADFITVAGQLDNNTHAEILYRKCGFVGKDTWWMLERVS